MIVLIIKKIVLITHLTIIIIVLIIKTISEGDIANLFVNIKVSEGFVSLGVLEIVVANLDKYQCF